MGSRAHFVIVKDGDHRSFYSQWAGYDLELELLPGPAAALRFIERQRVETGWTVAVMCDGAAVVDCDRRHLLWFSPCRGDLSFRAAAMAVLARTWPGWQIQWAYDGLADIVAYVGLDPETVKAPKTIPIPPDLRTPEKLSAAIPMFQFDPAVFPPGSLLPAELPLVSAPEPMADSDLDEDPECLITIAQDGEVRAYASRSSVGTVIEHGPQVLETCAGWKPARVQGRTPSGGIHLDAGTRSAGVWTGGVLYQALADAPRLWPGWHWERWGDRYGEQLARCAGTVIFPAPDLCAGLERLREQFDRHQDSDTATSSIALLLGVLGAIKGAADSVGLATHTIEDHSFDHRPVDLPEEERAMVMGVIGEILPECQT